MNTILLNRDYKNDTCSLGYASFGARKWASLERPWVPVPDAPCGRKGVSCVAPGTYLLVPHNSEQHGAVWALVNPQLWVYHLESDVPKNRQGLARTAVLIHVANFASEIRGCIALGKTRHKESGYWMVQRSRDAVNELRMALLGHYENQITITESTP